jgi:hypothetical protein
MLWRVCEKRGYPAREAAPAYEAAPARDAELESLLESEVEP